MTVPSNIATLRKVIEANPNYLDLPFMILEKDGTLLPLGVDGFFYKFNEAEEARSCGDDPFDHDVIDEDILVCSPY